MEAYSVHGSHLGITLAIVCDYALEAMYKCSPLHFTTVVKSSCVQIVYHGHGSGH